MSFDAGLSEMDDRLRELQILFFFDRLKRNAIARAVVIINAEPRLMDKTGQSIRNKFYLNGKNGIRSDDERKHRWRYKLEICCIGAADPDIDDMQEVISRIF